MARILLRIAQASCYTFKTDFPYIHPSICDGGRTRAVIGFFDSGFGGLTVMRSVVALLPQYDYLYLGDSARVPYGNRSADRVYEFTRQAVDFLFRRGCPLIIIACNTASANALRRIQQEYLPEAFPERRVLGVIRPAAEAIVEGSCRSVGILATEGVVASGAYLAEIGKLDPAIAIVQQACPLLVPIVEAGEQDRHIADVAVADYLERLFAHNGPIDAILLACTHYPILKRTIERHLPAGVALIDQGPVVAQKLKDYFRRHGEMEKKVTRRGERIFFTTDDCDKFDRLARIFYGTSVTSKLIALE